MAIEFSRFESFALPCLERTYTAFVQKPERTVSIHGVAATKTEKTCDLSHHKVIEDRPSSKEKRA
jgi:hypothetical protein